MSEHVGDDLPRLLTGDATRDETLAAAQHLRGCPDCQQELVAAVVAHASLRSAHRFAPDLVTHDAAPEPADPPSEPLPDLSAMFAQVRSEAAAAPEPSPRRRRSRLLAVAAAAVVLAGGGVTIAETVGSSGPSQPAAQRITLAPVGTNRAAATATVSGGTMRVDATSLPKLDASRQYEVWLADSTGGQVRALGFIGADRRADLPVPLPVMGRYAAIAISIQKTDQVAFSGDMVARGFYG